MTTNRLRRLPGRLLAAAALLPLAALAGCASSSNTLKGAGLGSLLGAGVGAGLGSITGNAGVGAAIGAGVGAAGGGLVGNDLDQQEKADMQGRVASAEAAAAHAQQAMGLTDVAKLAQSGASDAVILGQIRSTNSTFTLTTNDLQWLRENQVSDAVIQEMQCRRPGRVVVAPPPRVIIREVPPPPPVVERVYVVPAPPPPPPPGFHFRYSERW